MKEARNNMFSTLFSWWLHGLIVTIILDMIKDDCDKWFLKFFSIGNSITKNTINYRI